MAFLPAVQDGEDVSRDSSEEDEGPDEFEKDNFLVEEGEEEEEGDAEEHERRRRRKRRREREEELLDEDDYALLEDAVSAPALLTTGVGQWLPPYVKTHIHSCSKLLHESNLTGNLVPEPSGVPGAATADSEVFMSCRLDPDTSLSSAAQQGRQQY